MGVEWSTCSPIAGTPTPREATLISSSASRLSKIDTLQQKQAALDYAGGAKILEPIMAGAPQVPHYPVGHPQHTCPQLGLSYKWGAGARVTDATLVSSIALA